jgi:hypothetical protein
MNYQDFETNKFKILFNSDDIKEQNDRCKIINLSYNLKEFIILGCEMKFYGIYNRITSMYTLFDNLYTISANDSDKFMGVQVRDRDFIEFINKIYILCSDIINDNKEKIDMPHYINQNIKLSRATGFFHPLIYRENDDNPYMIIRIPDFFNSYISKYESIEHNSLDYIDVNLTMSLHIKSLCFNNGSCKLILEVVDLVD